MFNRLKLLNVFEASIGFLVVLTIFGNFATFNPLATFIFFLKMEIYCIPFLLNLVGNYVTLLRI